MPRILLILTVVLAGLVVLPVSISAQPAKKARSPLGIEKITDDLFVIIGNGGNVAVLVTNEGVILVDDKFEEDYEAIVAQVKTVTSQPVKYVFNTHHHSDHSGGNVRFIEIAEIISHKNARTNAEGGKQGNAPKLRPARIVFTDEPPFSSGARKCGRVILAAATPTATSSSIFPPSA